METSADHSIRNDWKNKHFPATPCFKLAYKSVNETIFLLSIITRYHRLALALPQFVELNRSTGLRLIGPFTTKSRFLSDFETNWNELLKFLPQWLKCPLYIFRFFFIFLFIHFFFFNLIRRVSREFSLHDQQIWDVFLTGTYKSVYIRSFHGRIIRNSDPWWEIFGRERLNSVMRNQLAAERKEGWSARITSIRWPFETSLAWKISEFFLILYFTSWKNILGILSKRERNNNIASLNFLIFLLNLPSY